MIHPALSAIDCWRATPQSDAPFWRGHLPFAGVLVALLRPRRVVELGVQHGCSLFCLAEAMRRFVPGGEVLGIDAWEGDAHVGPQAGWVEARVRSLAEGIPGLGLQRARFDAAAEGREAESIDLLHIDGAHDEASVRADLAGWMPKLAPGGVVMLHDVTAWGSGFGVWRVWQELAAAHPQMVFAHSAGLGLVAPKGVAEAARPLFDASLPEKLALAQVMAGLGHAALQATAIPEDAARAERIGRLPQPPGLDPDPLLAAVLAAARW